MNIFFIYFDGLNKNLIRRNVLEDEKLGLFFDFRFNFFLFF